MWQVKTVLGPFWALLWLYSLLYVTIVCFLFKNDEFRKATFVFLQLITLFLKF